MAIKDNPGIQTMPKTSRDWTKFINDLSDFISNIEITGGGGGENGLDIDDDLIWTSNNVGTRINGLTEDVSPALGDFVVTYDLSGDAGKKVSLTSLGAGGGTSADDELLHHWFYD